MTIRRIKAFKSVYGLLKILWVECGQLERLRAVRSAPKNKNKGRVLWFDSRVGGPELGKDTPSPPPPNQFTPEPRFHSPLSPNLQLSTSYRCRVSRQYTARYVTGAPVLPHFPATGEARRSLEKPAPGDMAGKTAQSKDAKGGKWWGLLARVKSVKSQPFTRPLRRVALLRGKKAGANAGKSRIDPRSSKEESEADRAKAAATLWEARLEVTEISRKEYREAARRLARDNEELERQQLRLEKDTVDVMSYLKKQEAEKEDLVGVEQNRTNGVGG
ncbi:hypothetical protein L345_01827, partial [Ophiophagus hannah]